MRTHDLRITGMGLKVVSSNDQDEGEPKRRREDSLDWWTRAPRWLLRALALSLIAALGFVVGQNNSLHNREQQRLDAAILDAPTKYQERLSQRVAQIEGALAAQQRSDERLKQQIDKQNETLVDLSKQITRLSVLIERDRNGQR